MKQFFLIFSLSMWMSMHATVRTVSNNPANLAQYSTIQAAVDAASSGDTILVHGSPTIYNTVTIIDKRLTILGPGWAPVRGFAPFKAIVQSVLIQGSGCDSSEIQGMVFNNTISLNFNRPNKMRFIRNLFKDQINISQQNTVYNGYVFQGNFFEHAVVSGVTNSTYTNFLFQNNIFYTELGWNNGNVISLSNCIGVIFDHNLWYGPSTGTAVGVANNCKSLLFTNNIFVRRDMSANLTQSTFNNNITFNAGVNEPWLPVYGNSGTNNIANQDPQMAAQTAVNSGTNDPLLDFTIAAGPANNSGIDGKDLGLLYDAAGALNWTNSRMPRIPFVYSMDISNPMINPGGTLSVQVEARKSN